MIASTLACQPLPHQPEALSSCLYHRSSPPNPPPFMNWSVSHLSQQAHHTTIERTTEITLARPIDRWNIPSSSARDINTAPAHHVVSTRLSLRYLHCPSAYPPIRPTAYPFATTLSIFLRAHGTSSFVAEHRSRSRSHSCGCNRLCIVLWLQLCRRHQH